MGVHNKNVYPQIKELLGIPDDEPIFILRGQDISAVRAISAYRQHASIDIRATRGSSGTAFLRDVESCIDDFVEFGIQNPGRIKTPD